MSVRSANKLAAAFLALLLALPPQARAQQSIAGGLPPINTLPGYPLTVARGGTGATTTVAARANLGAYPQVNAVKDLGFVGDGVTVNSYTLIDQMFAYTTSPVIYFDPGTYIVACPTKQENAASNIAWLGSGQEATVIKFTAGCALPNGTLYSWLTYTTTVSGFTLDLNGATQANVASQPIFNIVGTHYNEPTFDHLSIINGTTNMLYVAVTAGSGGIVGYRVTNNYLAMLASVTAATVVAGGSGGTNGACTVTGTTGTGTKVQLSGTVSGNALAGALTVANAGSYTAIPTKTSVEPVTGCGLSNATVNLTLSTTTSNQCINISAANGNITGGVISGNICANTGIFANGNYTNIQDNEIYGWAFGGGIVSGPDPSAHHNVFRHNHAHDSGTGLDTNVTVMNGFELWSDHSLIEGNIAYNNGGNGVASAGKFNLVIGNMAWDNARTAQATNQAGIKIASGGTTYNGSNNDVVGNFAWDSGVGTQSYGYYDDVTNIASVLVDSSNSFAGTVSATSMNGTTYRQVRVPDSTDSTSTTTGAWSTPGGVGIGKSVTVGGAINIAANAAGGYVFTARDNAQQWQWYANAGVARLFDGSADRLTVAVTTGLLTTPLHALNGTTLPTQAAGTLGIGGIASAPTLAANGEGDIYLSTTNGLTLQGQGSTYDVALLNKSGTFVAGIPTGTAGLASPGLNITGLDSGTGAARLLFSGTTQAIRIFTTAGTSASIEATDNTGIASFQPLKLGGLSIALQASQVTKLDYGVTNAGAWTLATHIVTKGYTVAGLPTGITGAVAYVTDAVACTFLAAPTGGSNVVCPVFYDGTSWKGG